jgi:23S rRNA pseudouridine1911/1915/1917 synthase
MPLLLRPEKETTLLIFLREKLSDWRPRTIKERLQRQCIQVNGAVVTHHAFTLHKNDEVEILRSPIRLTQPGGGIKVLYQDVSLVGIYKPAGLLSVGTDRVRSKHALAMVREALGGRQKLWPVHRLDRETSGVMLFARSRDVCDALQSQWNQVEKVYVAVVEGHLSPPEGLIDQPLYEDKGLRVRVRSHPAARDARTRYRTCETSAQRSLVEIHLLTGRRHQIRVHLAWLGNPVVGDARYGQKASRMALHAQRLSFQHPVSRKQILLKTKMPADFSKLLRGSRAD